MQPNRQFRSARTLDGDVVNTPISGASSFGAGPSALQVLTGGGGNVAIVAGWTTTGAFNSNNWFTGGAANPAGLTVGSINGSTGGWKLTTRISIRANSCAMTSSAPVDSATASLAAIRHPSVTLPGSAMRLRPDELHCGRHATRRRSLYRWQLASQTVLGNVGTLNVQAPAEQVHRLGRHLRSDGQRRGWQD